MLARMAGGRGRHLDHPDRRMHTRAPGRTMSRPRPERGPMAKPVFFYAGIYDSSEDAEMDYDAIKALHGRGTIGRAQQHAAV
jgi:hypothetical protein